MFAAPAEQPELADRKQFHMDARVALRHFKTAVHFRRSLPDGERHPAKIARFEPEWLAPVVRLARRSHQQRGRDQKNHRSYTIFPPTTVTVTRVRGISAAGTVMISPESITKSAILPGSIEPL